MMKKESLLGVVELGGCLVLVFLFFNLVVKFLMKRENVRVDGRAGNLYLYSGASVLGINMSRD